MPRLKISKDLFFVCSICKRRRPATELVMSVEGSAPVCKSHSHLLANHYDVRWTPQSLLPMFGYEYAGRKIVKRQGRPPKNRGGDSAVQGTDEA